MALQRAGKAAIERMVRERSEYRYGNLSGRKVGPTDDFGKMWIGHASSFHAAEYAIYSYQTPIAWYLKGRGWVIPAERYSNTTTNHQHNVRVALHWAGEWEITDDEVQLPDGRSLGIGALVEED